MESVLGNKSEHVPDKVVGSKVYRGQKHSGELSQQHSAGVSCNKRKFGHSRVTCNDGKGLGKTQLNATFVMIMKV